jgi:hypothetical protein
MLWAEKKKGMRVLEFSFPRSFWGAESSGDDAVENSASQAAPKHQKNAFLERFYTYGSCVDQLSTEISIQ